MCSKECGQCLKESPITKKEPPCPIYTPVATSELVLLVFKDLFDPLPARPKQS